MIIEMSDVKGIMKSTISVLGGFPDKLRAFKETSPVLAKLVLKFAAFLIILGPVITFLGQMIIAMAALKFAFAFLGIPIGAILLPIIAVFAAFAVGVAIGDLLANQLRKFPALWDAIGGTIVGMVEIFKSGFQKAIDFTSDLFFEISLLPDKFKAAFEATKVFISEFVTFLSDSFDKKLDELGEKLKKLNPFQDFGEKLGELAFEAFGPKVEFGDVPAIPSLDFGGQVDLASNNSSTLDINMRAAEGSVESVKTSSPQNSGGLNVGFNLIEGT
jgi:hypothetical protein